MSERDARAGRPTDAPEGAREPLVRTDALGGSPLSRAMQDGAADPHWMPPRPQDAAGWARRAGEVRARFDGRRWLDALGPAFSAGGRAAESLERVAAAGGVVVTTGQQPGLFGGPIYTWSKALTALALAREIEDATGLAAAAVFWAATDDSDYAEARRTLVAVPGGVELLEMPPAPASADRMLAEVPLPDVGALLDVLARGAGAAVHADVLDIARACYAPGTTVGGAYVSLLRALLEPLGIAVLDAAHPAVGAAMRPVLRDALAQAKDVEHALRARDRELEARGFEPQVQSVAGLSLVFRRDDGERQRVPLARAQQAADDDVPLGPNVLLRPIGEAAILPTVAYAAGPAEIAYFAQTAAVAEALGRPAPLAVPRWSCTILEPHVQRLLDRYGVDAEALRDPHAVEMAHARAAMPPAIAKRLEEFHRAIDALGEGLRGASAAERGLLPDPVIEGHRRALLHRADRLERRVLAAVKRRQADLARDLATARGALYPHGERQERALNFLPLLARHGPLLVERMRERARVHASAIVGAREGPARRATR